MITTIYELDADELFPVKFVESQWNVVKNQPKQLYNQYRTFTSALRNDDRGYKFVADQNLGFLYIIKDLYNTYKDLSIDCANYFPISKPEVEIVEYIEREYLGDLNIIVEKRRGDELFYPEDLPRVVEDIAIPIIDMFRRTGYIKLRKDVICHNTDPAYLVEEKKYPELWRRGYLSILKMYVKTWDESFPSDAWALYRAVFLNIDAYMPPKEQIVPNLLYKSRGLEPEIKLEDKRPENTKRKEMVIRPRVWKRFVQQNIRYRIRRREERRLCLAYVLKLHEEKRVPSEYYKRLLYVLKTAKKKKRRVYRSEIRKLLKDESFREWLFKPQDKAMKKLFGRESPPEFVV